MLTYNNGLKVKGSGYTMDIPDGFVIQKASDRDFIAYIPDPVCPDEYFESDFIIFAAQQISPGATGQFKTVAEFCSFAEAIGSLMPGGFGEVETAQYERKKLPGAVLYSLLGPDCLHAQLLVGIDDHFQQMRVQISKVNMHNKAKYKKMAMEIFDHIRADKPVELLEELDAKKYISMSDGSKAMAEWIKLVQEYAEHIGIVINIQQNTISSAFNENHDISQFKKDIRKMLKGISALADEEMVKAEAIYTLKRAEYPNSPSVKKMRAAVKSLIDLASRNAYVLGEKIAVSSSFASNVNARLDKPVSAVIDTICSEAVLNGSDVKNALLRAKTESAKAERKPTTQLANTGWTDKIRELMSGGEKLTAKEITLRLDISSTQRTTALLRKLIEDGYIVKADEVGVTYYMLHKVPDNKQSKKAQGAKAKTAKASADKSGQTGKSVSKNLKLLPLNLFDVLETVCKSQRIKAEDIQDQLKLSSAAKTSMMLNRLVEEAYLSKEFEQGTCYYTPTEDAYALLSDERQQKKTAEEREKALAKLKEKQEARDWSAKLESNKEFALSCLERVDEYKKRVDAAVAEREEQIKSEALQRIEILESKKAACEKKLETLGFFSFSEKRSTKEEIVGLQAGTKAENEALNSALSSLKQKGASTVDTYRCEVEEFLKKRYNLGNKKYMIDSSDYDAAFGKHSVSVFTDNKTLWEIISLMRSGEKYQCKDITVLANIISTQYASDLIGTLCVMGYVTSSTEEGTTYFMVNDQAVEAIYKHLEERLTREHSPYARYADNPEFSHLQCPEIPKAMI